MSKREKAESRQVVTVVRTGRSSSASAVVSRVPRRADPSLLDPYDWGPDGTPEGKPIRYVPGRGFVVED